MTKNKKITFDQIPDAIGSLIEEVADLKKMLANRTDAQISNEEEYLTPQEMAQALKVSMVTLWHWDKKEITQPLRVGNLKRYRKSDLEKIIVEYRSNKPSKTSNHALH